MLQGKRCVAFGTLTAVSSSRQRSIETLEPQLEQAKQQRTETQQKLALSEQQAAALQQKTQGLEIIVSELQQATELQDQQVSQAAAALQLQQERSRAEIAGLKVQAAQKVAAAEAQSQQQEQQVSELQVKCAVLGCQLELCRQQVRRQDAMQAQASAQAAAEQQEYQRLCDAHQELSAQMELHMFQSVAEKAALLCQIQQLQEEQAWFHALGHKLLSSDCSATILFAAAALDRELDTVAGSLQGAADADVVIEV
jgi:chromosome segregation ATPase